MTQRLRNPPGFHKLPTGPSPKTLDFATKICPCKSLHSTIHSYTFPLKLTRFITCFCCQFDFVQEFPRFGHKISARINQSWPKPANNRPKLDSTLTKNWTESQQQWTEGPPIRPKGLIFRHAFENSHKRVPVTASRAVGLWRPTWATRPEIPEKIK